MLTNERIPPGSHSAHMVEQYRMFLEYLGIDGAPPRLVLPANRAAAERADAIVASLGARPICFHVGATKSANRWPPERWGQLARACHARFGIPVCLTGGPSDVEAAAIAAKVAPQATNLAGRSSLLELAELQRRSLAVVSCDSGPMHLAVAAGARVVALFGAADERRTGPFGRDQRVVRTRPDCAPCERRECNQPRHTCMLDLEVPTVLQAIAEVLRL